MEFYNPPFDQSDGSNLHSYVLRIVRALWNSIAPLFDQTDGSNLHSYVLLRTQPQFVMAQFKIQGNNQKKDNGM